MAVLNLVDPAIFSKFNRPIEMTGGFSEDVGSIAEAADVGAQQPFSAGLGGNGGGFPGGRVPMAERAGDGIWPIGHRTDRVTEEQVRILGTCNDADTGATISAEREDPPTCRHSNRQRRHAVIYSEKFDCKAAEIVAQPGLDSMALHCRVLFPFRKAAGGDLFDPRMRIGVGVDVERNLRQQQLLYTTRMIKVSMRNDNVAHLLPRETARRHPSRQLEAPAGVDHQRLAAGVGDHHSTTRTRRVKRRAGAEHGQLHRCSFQIAVSQCCLDAKIALSRAA